MSRRPKAVTVRPRWEIGGDAFILRWSDGPEHAWFTVHDDPLPIFAMISVGEYGDSFPDLRSALEWLSEELNLEVPQPPGICALCLRLVGHDPDCLGALAAACAKAAKKGPP